MNTPLATLHLLDVGQPAKPVTLDTLETITRARVGPLPAADFEADGPGWLARLSRLSGAPLGLTSFELVPQPANPWRALDAFALATVYGQVLWDDRMPGWHGESGQPRSAQLLREIHDLAIRAYRNHEAGERLYLVSM